MPLIVTLRTAPGRAFDLSRARRLAAAPLPPPPARLRSNTLDDMRKAGAAAAIAICTIAVLVALPLTPVQGSLPVPRCGAAQLALRAGRAGVATGHYGFVLILRNVLAPACSVRGYPGIQLIDARGRPIPTHPHHGGSFTFPARPPRTVVLAPGASASFALGGDDMGLNGRACPSAAAMEIIPPNTSKQIALASGVPACGGRVDVSVVVAGTKGPHF
jgi:hypothetical protein